MIDFTMIMAILAVIGAMSILLIIGRFLVYVFDDLPRRLNVLESEMERLENALRRRKK